MTLTDETVQIADNGPARQLTVYEHGVPALQILTSDSTASGAQLACWLRDRQRRLDHELPELPLSGLPDDGSGVLPLVRIDPDDHHGSRPLVVPTGGRRGRQADLRLAHPRLC
ncbi:MAG TPA: hypothetical protein VFC16_18650 [Nakamurella sp.]|nr:hypothetical protein [Nakamurella sp.]